MLFLQSIRRWWADRGRNIFHYRVGSSWRRGDPVVLGSRLERLCPEYVKLLATLAEDVAKIPPGPVRKSMVDQQRDASTKLVEISRTVFSLPPLEADGPGGVTDPEALSILTRYFMFMEGLAKERDAQLFPTWPAAASPSRPPSRSEPSAASGTVAS